MSREEGDGDDRHQPLHAVEGSEPPVENLTTTLGRVEREIIVVALRASRGNKARAARALGISERLMGLRVKKHGINPRDFRTGR